MGRELIVNYEHKVIHRKIVAVLIYCLLFLAIGTIFTTEQTFAATIGQKEIKVGLEFCKSYPVSLTAGGNRIAFEAKDVPPVIITPKGEKNGRTLIPARALFETLGASVFWSETEQKVSVALGDKAIAFIIGNDLATVDDKNVKMDVPALIIDHDGDYYGTTMIPVRFVVEALGFSVKWDDKTRNIEIDISGKDSVNPDKSSTDSNASSQGGITAKGLPALCDEAKGKLIFIDSGHGGADSGAIALSTGQYEKNFNLPISIKLGEYLKEAGFNVYLIKEKDQNIPIPSDYVFHKEVTKSKLQLYYRAVIANSMNTDFFVSIHNNSSPTARSSGTEVICADKIFYGMYDDGTALTIKDRAIEWATSMPAIKLDESGEPLGTTLMENYGITSTEVAEAVMDNMVATLGTRKSRIINNNDYALMNCVKAPSIIVEGAFMSNPQDLAIMNRPDYSEKYAYATAKGIIEAFNKRYGK